MTAPTSIDVSVDRDEYSRFEKERDTVMVSVFVSGVNLLNEQIKVELVKARRSRDEVIQHEIVTLGVTVSHTIQVDFYLPEIVNNEAIPLARRGHYFVRASSVTNTNIVNNSDDFRISLISVKRLKEDYLHGTDQFSSDQLLAVNQPENITGVFVDDVSLGHPKAMFSLSYNYSIDSIPTIISDNSAPFTLSDGQTLILIIDVNTSKTVTFNTADFVDIANATSTEVIQVLTDQIPEVTATDVGGKIQIEGGRSSLFVDPTGTATTALGFINKSDIAIASQFLSWCNGPIVKINKTRRIYTLRRGNSSDYIKVHISAVALLPTESTVDEIFIDRKPLNEERINGIIEQAISWVEDTSIAVYLEPTRIVTEVDSTTVSQSAAKKQPDIVGAEWDQVVDAIHYKRPSAGHWLNFKFPYYPVLSFEKLYGKIANIKIIDIAQKWIEFHERTGWVELLPYYDATAFNFMGLVWVNSLQGPVPLPNFWNFSAIVGFRKTPDILLELVAKKAAMDVLSIAGQAFRGGFASQSVSRDGVSESVSYTASATFGIYSATIEDYRKWIDSNIKHLRGAFRGVNMTVV